MAQTVKRGYKYRFHPTTEQAEELARTFGCVRLVYNKALEERTRAYALEGRRVSYVESSAALTAWKRGGEYDFLSEVSSVPLQQALRHLQAAFANFFAKRAKYPTFKSRKKSRLSAEYTRSAFRWREGRLFLAKMDAPLDIVWSRPLPEGTEPSTVTVSRDAAGRWFVSIMIEEKIAPLPPVEQNVGMDAGVTALATLSTGEKIVNPRHERRDRRKLAKVQRALARKEKGSKNRARARLRVARVYARIADRRRDHLHKVTTRLVRDNQVIAVEDLTVRNMVKNRLKRLWSWCKTSTRVLSGGRPAVKQEGRPATVGIPLVYEGEDVNSSMADGSSICRVDLRTGRGAIISRVPGAPSLVMKLDSLGRLFVAGGTGGDARVESAVAARPDVVRGAEPARRRRRPPASSTALTCFRTAFRTARDPCAPARAGSR